MTLPKNDLPLEVLKTRFAMVNGELHEILEMDGQVAYFKPQAFMRGKYLCLYVFKNVHMAYHRVVWMLHHNIQIPRDETGQLYIVDHFDTNKLNNSTWNLRLVTLLENRNNTSKVVAF